jgi:hypothetical protein
VWETTKKNLNICGKKKIVQKKNNSGGSNRRNYGKKNCNAAPISGGYEPSQNYINCR